MQANARDLIKAHHGFGLVTHHVRRSHWRVLIYESAPLRVLLMLLHSVLPVESTLWIAAADQANRIVSNVETFPPTDHWSLPWRVYLRHLVLPPHHSIRNE